MRKGERSLKASTPAHIVGNTRSKIADIWEMQMKLAAYTHMAAEDLLRGMAFGCRHMVFSQVCSCGITDDLHTSESRCIAFMH